MIVAILFIMRGLKKFKKFDDANKNSLDEYCRNKLDLSKTEQYFQEMAGWIKNPYKPGLYKFSSFKEARDFDRQQYIKKAIARNSK